MPCSKDWLLTPRGWVDSRCFGDYLAEKAKLFGLAWDTDTDLPDAPTSDILGLQEGVTYPLMQVQHKAHGLAVEWCLIAAEAAVQDGKGQGVNKACPVSWAFLVAVQPARGRQQLLPASTAQSHLADVHVFPNSQ